MGVGSTGGLQAFGREERHHLTGAVAAASISCSKSLYWHPYIAGKVFDEMSIRYSSSIVA
jgi:hypothetical protein